MLDIFWGGYFFHPAALDYSGDTCQNGCAYCFANINKEFREGNLKGAINALYKKQPATYMDQLLSEGYPICISNRSDAFAANNIRDTRALFTHLAEAKNGLFIQTKCGPEMESLIAMLGDRRDVIIYITITTIRDEISKIVEPNALLPAERLAIAKRLHAAGYLVLIAVNPLDEAWMPREDLEALTADLKTAGLNHICLEMLDIKRKRLGTLSAGRRKRLLDAVDNLGIANRNYVRECTQYLIQQGFIVCKKGMPYRTEFYNDISARLGLTMPVLQDFVNYCFDTYGTSARVINYAEFAAVIAKADFFKRTFHQNTLRGYLLRSGFDTWRDNKQVHSHKELLSVIWNDPRHKMGIRNHSLFRAVGRGKTATLDESGNVQLYFDGAPHFGGKKEVIEL